MIVFIKLKCVEVKQYLQMHTDFTDMINQNSV